MILTANELSEILLGGLTTNMKKSILNTQVIFSIAAVLVFFGCAQPEKKDISESSDCMRMLFAQDLEGLKEKTEECVRYRTEEGITLLMMASSKGFYEIAEFLIEKGANVNSVNNVKQSALHYAAVHKQPKMIQLLKANNAEIKPNNHGITSLMTSIQMGTFEMVELHDPNFEDVNIRADDGWTAIYFAIRREDEKMLDFLLARGACINLKDDYKQTPLEFAKEVGWKKAVDKIKKGKTCNL